MITLQYIGEPTNLGRFGQVRRGDILNLSEEEGISLLRAKDARFRDPKAAGKDPIPSNIVKFTDRMSSADRAAAEKANADEQGRLDRLAVANDPVHIETMEIQQETYDELLARAERINTKHGAKTITVQGKVSRTDLINNILSAERRVPLNVGDPTDPISKPGKEPVKVGDAHSSTAAAGLAPNPATPGMDVETGDARLGKPGEVTNKPRTAGQSDPAVVTGQVAREEQSPHPGTGGKPLTSTTFTDPKPKDVPGPSKQTDTNRKPSR